MDFDKTLERLEIQKSQYEVSIIKLQGAIEIISQLKDESEKKDKEKNK